MRGEARHGEPVEVEGSVYDTQDGTGYRGKRGTVCGRNAENIAPDGTVRVNVRLEDGQHVVVPKAALKRRGG